MILMFLVYIVEGNMKFYISDAKRTWNHLLVLEIQDKKHKYIQMAFGITLTLFIVLMVNNFN